MSLRRLLIAPIGGLIIAAGAIGTGAAPAHAQVAYDNISYDVYMCVGDGNNHTCQNLTSSEYVAPGTQKTSTFTALQTTGTYIGGSVDATVSIDNLGNPTMQITGVSVFDLLAGTKNSSGAHAALSFPQGSVTDEYAMVRNVAPHANEYAFTYVTVTSNLPPAA